MRISRLLALAGLGLLLTACDQVDSAVSQANTATDKASACAQALGLANINPNLNADELAAQAKDKSDRLRELANRVADQNLKQNLFTIADSYVDLEKRKADHLSNLNDWIQRNTGNLANLRSACL
ncbi:hypothetical protein HFP15_20715 [Amycolatopsis sp. K13G38]|uniref:Secreted protein n=1 Tax=Amycolatopsis acididurans TaxID=2724524 RepID=A0ABX1JAK6_9PSEU|nr:hypothetical protein [Amycolatopsis acididurans]NKQ55312.1 hypothetical protein [Amycolatopsis acididurans]